MVMGPRAAVTDADTSAVGTPPLVVTAPVLIVVLVLIGFRKRRIITLTLATAAGAAFVRGHHGYRRRERREGFDFQDFTARHLHGREFERCFRLPKALFHKVLGRIRHRLATTNRDQALRSCGHVITPEQRFCVALRLV